MTRVHFCNFMKFVIFVKLKKDCDFKFQHSFVKSKVLQIHSHGFPF
jgi:hypothetical protein